MNTVDTLSFMIVEDANTHVNDASWSPEGMMKPVYESIDQF